MKNVFMMRKKKDAVSPVIATILMVAITVVLAAVLYVMVMGFGGNQTSTPTGTMTVTGNYAGTTGYANITFGQISPSVSYSGCKLSVLDQVTGSTLYVSNALVQAGTATTATWTAGNLAGAGFNNAANGNINVGDTLAISGTGLVTGHTYTVNLIYVSTGGVIATKTVTIP